MTLLTRIKVLCAERNTTLSTLEKELDFGNGTISKWDKATPSGDRLAKMADFFGVTVDYLLGREITAKDEKDIAKDLDKIMSKIKSGDDGPLRYNGETIDEESLLLLQDAIGMSLRHLKIINKEKYNPTKNKKG